MYYARLAVNQVLSMNDSAPNANILKGKLLTAPMFINVAIENAETLMGMTPFEWSTNNLADTKKKICSGAKGITKFRTTIETPTE